MKLISIIVPAYNVDAYLARCLDSILAQSYKNFEVILVDDGSSDKTPLICDEYSKKDNRIVVIHQKNAGVSAARNAALDIAKGDYIGCVDADDYIEPLMYEVMLKACEDNGAELACCAYEQLGAGSENREFTNEIVELNQEKAIMSYVSEDETYRITPSVWSKLFKKELAVGVRFPEDKNVAEDIYFSGCLLTKVKKCIYIDRPLYHYIVDRDGSIMNQKSNIEFRRINEELAILKKQIGIFEEANLAGIAEYAGYQLYKRELFYFYDFRKRKMKKAAQIIKDDIWNNRTRVKEIYANDFIKRGDMARMRLYLKSSFLYYLVMCVYNGIIVPIRQK